MGLNTSQLGATWARALVSFLLILSAWWKAQLASTQGAEKVIHLRCGDDVFSEGLVFWSGLFQRWGWLNNQCLRAGMEIQFICTVCYLLFNCRFCLRDGAEWNPGSPGCSQSFAIDSCKCKFSLLDFRGLCYGYMKYSVVTLSYFDKCYMDKEIFVISGEFSVVCMKVKQSL